MQDDQAKEEQQNKIDQQDKQEGVYVKDDDFRASADLEMKYRSCNLNQQLSQPEIKSRKKYHSTKTLQQIQVDSVQKDQYNKNFIYQERVSQWKWSQEALPDPEQTKEIRLLALTWNLYGSLPTTPLKNILKVEHIKHHIIVIGSQECQRSILKSFFVTSKDKWETMLRESVGPEYAKVESQTMNAMHICVFAHISIMNRLLNVDGDNIATGFANILGNQGGVGISMNIGDMSFLFVNCHLSSGQNSSDKRNKNFKEIAQGLNLPKNYKGDQKIKVIDRFDYIVWMGDLNYRIGNQDKDKVDFLLQNQDFITLLKTDQLTEHQEKGTLPCDLTEGVITFPPSYKLNIEENTFQIEQNHRIPGWTDRIMFKEKSSDTLFQETYDCETEAYGSDHRPVFSQFRAKVIFNSNEGFAIVQESQSNHCQIF